MTKFLTLILILLNTLPIFAQMPNSYKVKLGAKSISVSICIKQDNSYYISQDIFKALNLFYESKSDGNILIKDSNFSIKPKDIMGMQFINLKDLEKATGSILEINDTQKEVVFWNKIKEFAVYDDILEIKLSLPVKSTVFIWNNKLIFDFENTKDSTFPDYKCDESEKIETIRFGTQANNITRVVSDLLVEAKDIPKTDKYDTVIRYNLKSFILPEVIKIDDVTLIHDKNKNPLVILVGGAYSNPTITGNINNGNYAIKINDGIIKDIKIKRFISDVSLTISDSRTILLDTNQIYSHKIEKQDKDLHIIFTPLIKSNIKEMKVVLDAGHGGNDGGATHNNTKEKDVNLKFILVIAEYLKNAGVKVILTRQGDTYLSLSERGQVAIDTNADVFISVHCNSSSKPDSSSGIETYYHKDITASKYLGNIFHAYLIKGNKLPDRGVKSDSKLYQSGLGVLRKANSGDVPCILIEAGFINNGKDRALLLSEEYQRKMAEDILNTIKAFSTGKPMSNLKL